MIEEKRVFMRHPSDIPIQILPENPVVPKEESLCDVSVGGLSMFSDTEFGTNTVLKITIPIINPVFEARGKVVWCNRTGNCFEVGIEFMEAKDAFRARMVEQICHIEHYKKEIREKEGRQLDGKEAALEWINKYAGSFEKESFAKIEK